MENVYVEAVKKINEICGKVNFDVHHQMKGAIEATLQVTSPLLVSPEPSLDWSKVVDEKIDVPDHLLPLFQKVGMQLRFFAYSDKNEILTVAHIVQLAEEFFTNKKYEK